MSTARLHLSEVIIILRKSTVKSAARIANVSIMRTAQMFTRAHLHYFLLPCIWKTETVGLHLWLLQTCALALSASSSTMQNIRHSSSADTHFSERHDTSQRPAPSKHNAVRYMCHWNLISGTREESAFSRKRPLS
jgi:hypothetical protein